MRILRTCLLAAGFAAGSAVAAHAATFGVAVTGDGSHTAVGGQPAPTAAEAAALQGIVPGDVTGNIVGYYIPLDGPALGSSCTFGDCGLSADKGTGHVDMTMWLKFGNVDGGNSTLNFYFEDLDLIGGNDPYGFFESVSIFGTVIDSLAGDYSGAGITVSGDASTQKVLTVDAGNLAIGSDYWVGITFKADVTNPSYKCRAYIAYPDNYAYKRAYCPQNTPEFLVATLEGDGNVIPLPAAGWLMLAGLGGLAALRRRR